MLELPCYLARGNVDYRDLRIFVDYCVSLSSQSFFVDGLLDFFEEV